MRGGELLRRLGRELDTVLVGGDRLVLRAVVLEDAPDVAQPRDRQQIDDEDAEPGDTFRGTRDPTTCLRARAG
jgi:hypothetical protein